MQNSRLLILKALIILFIITGCLKRDIHYDLQKNKIMQCRIVSHSSVDYDALSFGNGFIKKLNNQGWVTYVETAVSGTFDFVDSLWYHMEYEFGNGKVIAQITVVKKHYQGAMSSPENLQPDGYPEEYTMMAWFDPVKGYLIRINGTGGSFPGDFLLQYKIDEIWQQ
jgi:hypothetical protein